LFSTIPDTKTDTPQHQRHIEHLLDLCRRMGEYTWIRVGRGATHVSRVGKQVRRAPQQFNPGILLQLSAFAQMISKFQLDSASELPSGAGALCSQ